VVLTVFQFRGNVLRLARGRTAQEIAFEIGGTERQVAAQRETLLKKLQIKGSRRGIGSMAQEAKAGRRQ
jgi:DNA-binding NarL/FixJ family response regulator